MTTHLRSLSLAAAMAALSMTSAPGAARAEESPALQGRYGMTAMGTCLSSPNGFLANGVAVEPSSVSSLVNRGELIFNRDGTGSAHVLQTQLNPPPAPAAFSGSAEITFGFTHAMGRDGAVTVNMRLDTYAATYLTGPLAGASATFVTAAPLSDTWVWSGTVSEDRKTLLMSNGDTLSRAHFSNGFEAYVVCQFERVLSRMTR